MLIIMQTPKRRGTKKKYVKIYDLVNKKILWNHIVTNLELFGRIKSSLYTLVDGHMYYSNCIIKIRYDLLQKKNMQDLKENEAFDFYENVLSLEPEELVRIRMPICSLRYHRFVYMTYAQKSLRPSKIMFLPFLHERKVYLSRMDDECDYFYNTIRARPEIDEKHDSILCSHID